jgi:hypothetical protein
MRISITAVIVCLCLAVIGCFFGSFVAFTQGNLKLSEILFSSVFAGYIVPVIGVLAGRANVTHIKISFSIKAV